MFSEFSEVDFLFNLMGYLSITIADIFELISIKLSSTVFFMVTKNMHYILLNYSMLPVKSTQ